MMVSHRIPSATRLPSLAAFLIFGAFLVACEASEPTPEQGDAVLIYELPPAPEIGTGYTEKPGWEAERHMVTAAHPLAVDAGFQVLEAGGTALDAAIAVQMVLTLVEPQSSGIGGGAFLLHFDGAEVTAFNGRETAPAAADETLFLGADGQPIPFQDAVRSGLSVGTPGTIAMLHQAHARHGGLAWEDVLRPAIALAEEGFEVSPRLNALLASEDALRADELAGSFYYDEEGEPRPVGYRLRNPALAEVLSRVAREGPQAFYTGPVADDMVQRVRSHPERPGLLSLEDLAEYPRQDVEVDPLCSIWMEWRVCGFPPPSSGHLAVGQILGILAALPGGDAPLADDGLPDPDWLHLYSEASRLAYADRALFVADARFVDAPGGDWATLLDPDYLASRAGEIGERSMGEAEAGTPAPMTVALGPQPEQPEAGTSHLSVVDGFGNAVSMTMTIEQGFGSRILSDGGTGLAGGFLLNNELTDFSRAPQDELGQPIANRVEGGKRPRSSMAPTLVFEREGGALVAATGSPGGAAIIHYTTKSILGMLRWGLTPQEAADLPNFTAYNSPATVLERDRFPISFHDALAERGHEVVEQALTSGIHAILRTTEGWAAGADPRREGWGMGR